MCAGLTLRDADRDIFDEVMAGLASRDFSPAGEIVADDLADAIADSIRESLIARRCKCGEDYCRTYDYDVPKKGNVAHFVVSIHARGELLVHTDNEGTIYSVERLFDPRPGARTTYSRQSDGSWTQRTI